jgi:hypothetical protein
LFLLTADNIKSHILLLLVVAAEAIDTAAAAEPVDF